MGNTNAQIWTNAAKLANMNSNVIKIVINITSPKEFKCKFIIHALYSPDESIKNIMETITLYLQKKYYPLKFEIFCIDFDNNNKTFIKKDKEFIKNGYKAQLKHPLIKYNKNDIVKKGISVKVTNRFQHNVLSTNITCQYMINTNSNDPLCCPIYNAMKQKYEFNKQNLEHLNEFIHFKDEYNSKPQCKHKDECKSYIRLQSGNNNQLNDLCHIKLYKHPPRDRNIKLSSNIHSLVINKDEYQNHSVYIPKYYDDTKYNYNQQDGYLYAIIDEVISNGYKYDLCLQCTKNDECKHDGYSLLKIVDEKLGSLRHRSMNSPLNRGHMLSLVLYTGCDCNYDLCSSQRNGDYKKWKFFDFCLCWAIKKLSKKESGSFSVFSGLNKVKLDKNVVSCGYFVTYTSTTWKKEVSQNFMGDEGMIIQIDESFKNNGLVNCCDVSWISKFPDECEILFARSVTSFHGDRIDAFKCIVLDEANGIQTVALSKNNN